MPVDTDLEAREDVWRPTTPPTSPASADWKPKKSSGGRRALLTIAIVAGALIVFGGFLNLIDDSNEGTLPTDEKVVAPQRSMPSQDELRARYAGRYDNSKGESLWLHKNGSYTIEGYVQMGGSDLEWSVNDKGRIFVMTYYSSDYAGQIDFSGRTYDIKKRGRVLVQIHPKSGRPYIGGRYTKVGK